MLLSIETHTNGHEALTHLAKTALFSDVTSEQVVSLEVIKTPIEAPGVKIYKVTGGDMGDGQAITISDEDSQLTVVGHMDDDDDFYITIHYKGPRDLLPQLMWEQFSYHWGNDSLITESITEYEKDVGDPMSAAWYETKVDAIIRIGGRVLIEHTKHAIRILTTSAPIEVMFDEQGKFLGSNIHDIESKLLKAAIAIKPSIEKVAYECHKANVASYTAIHSI